MNQLIKRSILKIKRMSYRVVFISETTESPPLYNKNTVKLFIIIKIVYLVPCLKSTTTTAMATQLSIKLKILRLISSLSSLFLLSPVRRILSLSRALAMKMPIVILRRKRLLQRNVETLTLGKHFLSRL
jgi:hypothetical protein